MCDAIHGEWNEKRREKKTALSSCNFVSILFFVVCIEVRSMAIVPQIHRVQFTVTRYIVPRDCFNSKFKPKVFSLVVVVVFFLGNTRFDYCLTTFLMQCISMLFVLLFMSYDTFSILCASKLNDYFFYSRQKTKRRRKEDLIIPYNAKCGISIVGKHTYSVLQLILRIEHSLAHLLNEGYWIIYTILCHRKWRAVEMWLGLGEIDNKLA